MLPQHRADRKAAMRELTTMRRDGEMPILQLGGHSRDRHLARDCGDSLTITLQARPSAPGTEWLEQLGPRR